MFTDAEIYYTTILFPCVLLLFTDLSICFDFKLDFGEKNKDVKTKHYQCVYFHFKYALQWRMQDFL